MASGISREPKCLVLYKPKETFTIRIDQNYLAVLNPFARRTVTVISKKARDFLDSFQGGKTLEEAYSSFPKTSKQEFEATVKELRDADLLFESSNPVIEFGTTGTLGVWVHITNRCNLRCRYCYLKKTEEDMSEETMKKVVDACFRSAKKHRKKKIKFKLSGGEALLNFSLIKQLVYYANNKAEKAKIQLEYVILSNGVKLTDKMVEFIKENRIRIMISLDGIGKWHDKQRVFPDGSGSFKYVDKTIKRILKEKIPFNLSVTVSHENIKGLPELLEYALKDKIPFSLNLYRENACSEQDKELSFDEKEIVKYFREAFKVIEKQMPEECFLRVLSDRADLSAPHNYTCAVGHSYLVFDQAGNVAKCQMDIKNTVSSAEADDPLKDVIDSKKGIQNLSVEKKTPCKSCFWRYYCCGGCPLLTYTTKGKYNTNSPNCKIYKQLLPEVLRLEGLRLLKYGG